MRFLVLALLEDCWETGEGAEKSHREDFRAEESAYWWKTESTQSASLTGRKAETWHEYNVCVFKCLWDLSGSIRWILTTFLSFRSKKDNCKSKSNPSENLGAFNSRSGWNLTSRHKVDTVFFFFFWIFSKQDQETCCSQTQVSAFTAGATAHCEL